MTLITFNGLADVQYPESDLHDGSSGAKPNSLNSTIHRSAIASRNTCMNLCDYHTSDYTSQDSHTSSSSTLWSVAVAATSPTNTGPLSNHHAVDHNGSIPDWLFSIPGTQDYHPSQDRVIGEHLNPKSILLASLRSGSVPIPSRSLAEQARNPQDPIGCMPRAICDRCQRAWLCKYIMSGSESYIEIAESAYPLPGPPRNPLERRVHINPNHIRTTKRMKMVHIPLTACPGNTDESCLLSEPIRQSGEHWPILRTTSSVGFYLSSNDAHADVPAWTKIGFPPLDIMPDQQARTALLKSGHGVSWVNYLGWRLLWVHYFFKKSSRSPECQLPIMKGHVSADMALWSLQLVDPQYIEDQYCLKFSSIYAMWRLREYSLFPSRILEALELFASIRRKLSKAKFIQLKSAILRLQTAIRNSGIDGPRMHVLGVGPQSRIYRRFNEFWDKLTHS